MEPEPEMTDVIALSQALREERLTRFEESKNSSEKRRKFKEKNLEEQKYNKLPNLIPRNFEDFLDKYPICNEIYSGRGASVEIGPFHLNKENLIDKILDFFQDQGIDENAFKICLRDYDGQDIREFLNGRSIKELRKIPKAIYICDKPLSGKIKSKKPKTHKRNTKQRKRKTGKKKKKSQKGGFCAPCLLGPLFTAAGLGTTGYMMSSSSSSSSSNINGKRSVKREEKYKITKNGKTHKREFKQNNKRVYDGKKISKYDNLKEASKAYNDLIKGCKAKGFQKC